MVCEGGRFGGSVGCGRVVKVVGLCSFVGGGWVILRGKKWEGGGVRRRVGGRGGEGGMGKRKTRKTRVYNLTERSPLVSETRPDIKETLKFVAPYIWPKTKMLQVLAVMALMCTICVSSLHHEGLCRPTFFFFFALEGVERVHMRVMGLGTFFFFSCLLLDC